MPPCRAIVFLLAFLFSVDRLHAQELNSFEQLGTMLPTPNETRAASGAPGNKYWQQKADYLIYIHLDDKKQRISGKETITYHNLSPDPLSYVWLQLDQNSILLNSDGNLTRTGLLEDRVTASQLTRMESDPEDRGFNVISVTTTTGQTLPFTINKTMMRVDLAQTLAPGASTAFKIE